MTMRILVINGNTMEAMTDGIHREGSDASSPGVEVVTVTPEVGPMTIESFYDDYLAIPGILKEILKYKNDVDAFVIACWGDPGIEAAREITDKPVVGIAEASMYVCNMIAAKWAVATVRASCGREGVTYDRCIRTRQGRRRSPGRLLGPRPDRPAVAMRLSPWPYA